MLAMMIYLFIFIALFSLHKLSVYLGRIGYDYFGGERAWKIGRALPWFFLGCFVVYNVLEYIYIRNQVKNLCEKEAGVFVYVSPERWKKENKDGVGDIVKEVKSWRAEKFKTIIVDGLEYEPRTIYTAATYYWRREENSPNTYTDTTYQLLVDNETGEVLLKSVYFSTGVGNYFQGNASSYKFWMNEVPSCSFFNRQFYEHKKLYY